MKFYVHTHMLPMAVAIVWSSSDNKETCYVLLAS